MSKTYIYPSFFSLNEELASSKLNNMIQAIALLNNNVIGHNHTGALEGPLITTPALTDYCITEMKLNDSIISSGLTFSTTHKLKLLADTVFFEFNGSDALTLKDNSITYNKFADSVFTGSGIKKDVENNRIKIDTDDVRLKIVDGKLVIIDDFGVCGSASANASKVLTLTNFSLYTGARLTVKFTYGNTASNPTLNVNNSGAVAIKVLNTTSTILYIPADSIVDFVFDGTNWVCQPTHYIVDYTNGTDWYRIWSDGWTEQGSLQSYGASAPPQFNGALTLLIPMASIFSVELTETRYTGYTSSSAVTAVNPTSVTVMSSTTGSGPGAFLWKIAGYKA